MNILYAMIAFAVCFEPTPLVPPAITSTGLQCGTSSNQTALREMYEGEGSTELEAIDDALDQWVADANQAATAPGEPRCPIADGCKVGPNCEEYVLYDVTCEAVGPPLILPGPIYYQDVDCSGKYWIECTACQQ